MSPLSQCFPDSVTLAGTASDARDGEHRRVARVVQGGADVVAHAAVDADVGAQAGQLLDRADLVHGHGGRPGDRASRLDGQARHGQACCGALLLDDGAQTVGVVEDVHRVVGGGVGDALAAAEVELGQHDAVLVADLGQQRDHAVSRQLEAVHVEDVAADVAVQPDQLERGQSEHRADRLSSSAARQREAELLVLLAGLDVLVGVRLDARRHADVDPLAHAVALGDRCQALDLDGAVDDETADAGADPALELGDALVVAVEQQPLGGEACLQRDGQLAAGAHVERQALLGDPAGDRRAEERLAGVVDVAVVERLPPAHGTAPGSRPRRGRRRGVPNSAARSRDVDPGQREHARRRRGPPRAGQTTGSRSVPAHGPRRVVTSAPVRSRRAGAGRSPAPTRVARHSSSRGAVVGATSSSPLGSTWQSSQKRCADLATFSSR